MATTGNTLFDHVENTLRDFESDLGKITPDSLKGKEFKLTKKDKDWYLSRDKKSDQELAESEYPKYLHLAIHELVQILLKTQILHSTSSLLAAIAEFAGNKLKGLFVTVKPSPAARAHSILHFFDERSDHSWVLRPVNKETFQLLLLLAKFLTNYLKRNGVGEEATFKAKLLVVEKRIKDFRATYPAVAKEAEEELTAKGIVLAQAAEQKAESKASVSEVKAQAPAVSASVQADLKATVSTTTTAPAKPVTLKELQALVKAEKDAEARVRELKDTKYLLESVNPTQAVFNTAGAMLGMSDQAANLGNGTGLRSWTASWLGHNARPFIEAAETGIAATEQSLAKTQADLAAYKVQVAQQKYSLVDDMKNQLTAWQKPKPSTQNTVTPPPVVVVTVPTEKPKQPTPGWFSSAWFSQKLASAFSWVSSFLGFGKTKQNATTNATTQPKLAPKPAPKVEKTPEVDPIDMAIEKALAELTRHSKTADLKNLTVLATTVLSLRNTLAEKNDSRANVVDNKLISPILLLAATGAAELDEGLKDKLQPFVTPAMNPCLVVLTTSTDSNKESCDAQEKSCPSPIHHVVGVPGGPVAKPFIAPSSAVKSQPEQEKAPDLSHVARNLVGLSY